MEVDTMLMRSDPFRELDRLTQQVFGTNGTLARPSVMPMDAWREGDSFHVEFDLPGVNPESIDLDVERNVVTVKAERPARASDAELIAAERPRGIFSRQDAATRLANLQAGTSDLGVTLDSDQAAQLKKSPNAQPLTGLTERVADLRLNTTKPPFDDIQVRQAAAYAIDKAGIVDGILGEFDKPVNVMAAPPVFGFAADVPAPTYDLAKAKALVAEAGPGARAEIELATSPTFDQRVVQALQQMLNEAGLNVKLNMSDMASYLKRAQAGPEATSTLSFGRWSCACQDADGILFPLLHNSSSWSAYRSPQTDKLLEVARQTLDKEKRLALYRQVHEIVAQEVPLIPLYQSAVIYGATKHLKWQPTPNESMFLNRMAWTE